MPAETRTETYSIPARAYAMGKQYTYNFTFTLNKVEFVLDNDLDVSGWGNPETVDEPADIPVQ
jgi:hypothetical protein